MRVVATPIGIRTFGRSSAAAVAIRQRDGRLNVTLWMSMRRNTMRVITTPILSATFIQLIMTSATAITLDQRGRGFDVSLWVGVRRDAMRVIATQIFSSTGSQCGCGDERSCGEYRRGYPIFYGNPIFSSTGRQCRCRDCRLGSIALWVCVRRDAVRVIATPILSVTGINCRFAGIRTSPSTGEGSGRLGRKDWCDRWSSPTRRGWEAQIDMERIIESEDTLQLVAAWHIWSFVIAYTAGA